MNMVKRTWAEISLNAIEHNYNVIRNKVADDTKVCCVIKADGYGHGAVELSQIYEKLGADFFAVSNIDEGIEIIKTLIGLGLWQTERLMFTPLNDCVTPYHLLHRFLRTDPRATG